MKRIIHPVGYWRYPVFNVIIETLKKTDNLRVLDIGSPKLLALFLALRKGFEVYATDLQDHELFSVWQTYYLSCKKLKLFKKDKYENKQLYNPQIQDGRELDFPNNYFELVYSISVLEHIPENGDSVTMKEIQRVLKPQGMAIIEVPFSEKEYNSYVKNDVYERKYIDSPVFYQRHYDNNTIHSRIIIPSGLSLESCIIIKEKIPYEFAVNKLPPYLQIPFLLLTPIISILNHKKYNIIMNNDKIKRKSHGASDVILILKKK
jgi:SAM-dependent methyltransferase